MAASKWIVIIIKLSHKKKLKIFSLLDSYLMKSELRRVPRASEAKRAKMQTELTRKI